jgi:hypothetical protein
MAALQIGAHRVQLLPTFLFAVSIVDGHQQRLTPTDFGTDAGKNR